MCDKVQTFVAAGSIRLCTVSNRTAWSEVTEILESVSEVVEIAIR